MKTYSFNELIEKTNEDNSGIFEGTLYISLNNGEKINRKKGVDTIMFDCENGTTLIIEKDCETKKVLGIEIFE
ncbi:MAG TPA: hypothetical protein PKY81_02985 [bacterium]|nr:hypothetical protein [bacterium]HPN29902.1 hypothetical protein [bacterium]